jgi:hypothetical protein
MTTEAPERDLAAENEALRAQIEEQELTAAETEAAKAVLAAQVTEQERQIEELKPTRDVAKFLFETPEDVVAHYGDKKLDEMLKATIAEENKARTKQGFDRTTYTPEEFAERKEALVADLLGDRTRWGPPTEGFLDRTMKMIKPDGTLVQIPFEGQINNVAGSLNDGLFRYQQKGYKLTDPMLCPTKDCNETSAIKKGKWLYLGYCSEDHYRRTEWQRQATPAV